MTKTEAIFKCQHELCDKGPFFQTEMVQYAEQLAFEKGVEFIIEKACEWWENEFQISMMDFQDSKDFYNKKLENFRKAMEEKI